MDNEQLRKSLGVHVRRIRAEREFVDAFVSLTDRGRRQLKRQELRAFANFWQISIPDAPGTHPGALIQPIRRAVDRSRRSINGDEAAALALIADAFVDLDDGRSRAAQWIQGLLQSGFTSHISHYFRYVVGDIHQEVSPDLDISQIQKRFLHCSGAAEFSGSPDSSFEL